MTKLACIKTFGCQMNIHDSEYIKAELEVLNYSFTQNYDEADLIVINTCSVREKPEKKLSYLLTQVKGIKRRKPNLIVIVCGCTAQQLGQSIQEEFSFVDLVFGPDELINFSKLFQEVISTKNSKSSFNFYDEFSYIETKVSNSNINHAYLTVMKGCNSYCSYCIVPYLRGKEKSRKKDEILNDINNLISKEINSITLIAQNISRYKSEANYNLADLLYEIKEKCLGLKKLSFLTSHPKDFDLRLIKCFEDIDLLAPILHLPAQHGSNSILEKMNRAYKRQDYLNIVFELQKSKIWEKLNFTTDIIIGFPGETEKDFLELMSLLEIAKFDNSFTFIYSPRSGTKAYKDFGPSVDPALKVLYTQRLKIYQDKQKEISLQKNETLINKTMEVNIESISYKDSNKLSARTFNGKVVNFKKPENTNLNIGDFIFVNIDKASPTHLLASFIKK